MILVMWGLFRALRRGARRVESGVAHHRPPPSAPAGRRRESWKARIARATNFVNAEDAERHLDQVVAPALGPGGEELPLAGSPRPWSEVSPSRRTTTSTVAPMRSCATTSRAAVLLPGPGADVTRAGVRRADGRRPRPVRQAGRSPRRRCPGLRRHGLPRVRSSTTASTSTSGTWSSCGSARRPGTTSGRSPRGRGLGVDAASLLDAPVSRARPVGPVGQVPRPAPGDHHAPGRPPRRPHSRSPAGVSGHLRGFSRTPQASRVTCGADTNYARCVQPSKPVPLKC